MKYWIKAVLFSAGFIGALSPIAVHAGGYVSYGLGYNTYSDWDDWGAGYGLGYGYGGRGYYPRHFGGYPYYGYGYAYPGSSYGVGYGCCHGDNDGGDLLAGLLLGGLLGYAINQSVNDRYTRTARAYPARPAARAPRRSASTIRVAKRANPECLMTREYTGMITIGGEQKPAYGVRCMKPDGSWTYGPLKAEPAF